MTQYFVTTFNTKLYKEFAKDSLASWLKFFPEDSKIECWIEGPFPQDLPSDSRITYKMIDTHPVYKDFIKNWGDVPVPQTSPGNAFRFRYKNFWFKVFALTETFFSLKYTDEYSLAWIDADVVLTKPLYEDTLTEWLGSADVAWLDRDPPWYCIESGFMLFRLNENVNQFLTELQNTYLSGFIFDLQEWHDGFILKALSKMHRHVLTFRSLTINPTERDAFVFSPLNEYMVHKKGNLKYAG